RTGTARAHDVEGLTEDARHQRRLAHRHRPLRHGLRDSFNVYGLKIFLVEPRPRRLAGDAQDRNRICDRRIKTRDHVGSSGTGGADAYTYIASLGAGVTLRHVGGTLDMTRQNVADRAVLLQR